MQDKADFNAVAQQPTYPTVDCKKLTRRREKPVKKWTKEDHDKLLHYLVENVDIEKPTAQIYYKKLIEETKIDAKWDMIRSKVRYLKSTYTKAEEWRSSTGAGLDLDNCATIKEKLRKMCSHYDLLAELFHNKSCADVVVETSQFVRSPQMYEDVEFLEENLQENSILEATDSSPMALPEAIPTSKSDMIPLPETVTTHETAKNSGVSLAASRKLIKGKTGLNELTKIQQEE